MTCQDFWNTMPELGCDETSAAELHLRECEACSALREGHRALAAGLRSLAAEESRLKPSGRVEGRLLAAFHGQNGSVTHRERKWWVPAGAWLAAAAVLVGAVLLVLNAKRPEPAVYETAQTTVDWTQGLPADALSERGAGEFISLPNAERLPQDGHLNLVRVELPRTAMIALGYTVEADRAQEKVEAEVILGSDGLARAVRFLEE
jgi:hypothetical protein